MKTARYTYIMVVPITSFLSLVQRKERTSVENISFSELSSSIHGSHLVETGEQRNEKPANELRGFLGGRGRWLGRGLYE